MPGPPGLQRNAISARPEGPSAQVLRLALHPRPTRELFDCPSDRCNPQQNGRHERMHLTLEAETTKPAGIKQVDDKLWLASFMSYDLGYFDEDTCRLEPIENPFAARVLPGGLQ